MKYRVFKTYEYVAIVQAENEDEARERAQGLTPAEMTEVYVQFVVEADEAR